MEKKVDQKNMIEASEIDPGSRFDPKTGLFKPRFDISALKTKVVPYITPKGK